MCVFSRLSFFAHGPLPHPRASVSGCVGPLCAGWRFRVWLVGGRASLHPHPRAHTPSPYNVSIQRTSRPHKQKPRHRQRQETPRPAHKLSRSTRSQHANNSVTSSAERARVRSPMCSPRPPPRHGRPRCDAHRAQWRSNHCLPSVPTGRPDQSRDQAPAGISAGVARAPWPCA